MCTTADRAEPVASADASTKSHIRRAGQDNHRAGGEDDTSPARPAPREHRPAGRTEGHQGQTQHCATGRRQNCELLLLHYLLVVI